MKEYWITYFRLVANHYKFYIDLWGWFCWHRLSLILAWIDDYVNYEVWVKLPIHYQALQSSKIQI